MNGDWRHYQHRPCRRAFARLRATASVRACACVRACVSVRACVPCLAGALWEWDRTYSTLRLYLARYIYIYIYI